MSGDDPETSPCGCQFTMSSVKGLLYIELNLELLYIIKNIRINRNMIPTYPIAGRNTQ